MKPRWLLWILCWQPQLLLLFIPIPKVVSSAIGTASSTELGQFGEPQWRAPTFTRQPPNRIDFLNELGAAIVCEADGFPIPQIYWQGGDNKIVTNIDNFRSVLSNSTLIIHPFKPASYRQDVHSTTYRCVASNAQGAIRSRDIQVRAVIAQPWSVKVGVIPTRLSPGAGPVLLKCEVDLMGGDFIEVTGWKRDGKFIRKQNQRFYGSSEEGDGHFHILPNGDLVIESLQREDAQSKILCITRHKITQQETVSPSFFITFTDKSNHAQVDESNIAESFPAPIVVREGDPIVLHCYEPSPPFPTSELRWEKLAGSSWMEMPVGSMSTSKFFHQIGSSLVSEKSSRGQAGHYRCVYGGSGNSKEKLKEFEVRVSEPLSVKVTINQVKSPLESTAEITCTVTSSSFSSPSVSWLKDANLINPGGRIQFFSTNVLQINQIQLDDQGVYQCIARTEMESAQDSVRLELADAAPRRILGFIEQTLSAGPSVSFICRFSAWPTPSITWLLDNNWPVTPYDSSRILIGNVTSHGHLITYLNITETRVEDGGLYTCKATNRAGTISHSNRLNIYGRLWIRVVAPVTAVAGDFFVLNCPIAGWPISLSTITWEKDGKKLPFKQQHRVGSNGSLTITLVDKADGGAYWCSITDLQGRAARREIQVNVVAPLKISPFPENGSFVEGERMYQSCSVVSGDPPIQIRWTFIPSSSRVRLSSGGGIISQGGGTSTTTSLGTAGVPLFTVQTMDQYTSFLSIAKLTESHAGKYTCIVSSSSSAVGVAFRSYDVTVLVPPKIEPFTFQEGLTEKMMTRLVCGVSQGDLPIQFTWLKDSKQLTMSKDELWSKNIEISTLDPYSTLLRFSSLSESQSGLYSCLASNSASQTHFSAKLVVQVAPRWVHQPEDINITRGRDAQFDCVGYGIPAPKISWLKATGDGGDVTWRSVETIWPSTAAQAISLANGSLIFSVVEESHEGQYMCSVHNSIGTGLSKIVQLHVHVQPYFVGSESQPISLTQGKTHEISCEAVSSAPIYLTWSKGTTLFVNVPANRIHTIIVMEGRKTKSTLVMKDIRSGDEGVYQCTASNALGKVTRIYRLVVEEQPGAPGRLRLAAEENQGNGPEATRVYSTYLEWDPPSEYSSNPSQFPGGDPSLRGTTPTTVFPPILMYVLEYSLHSEEKMRFSQQIEISGEKTKVKVDNLSPASVYLFRVSAINSAGKGPPSESLLVRTANIPPSVSPSNIRAAAVSARAILVSWSPVPIEMAFGKILAYRIVIGTNSDISLGKPEGILVPVAASYRNFHNNATFNEQNCCQTVIHGLNPFTHYEIKVGALNIAGAGPLSSSFSVKTAEEAPQLPPRNPQCLPLTSRSIQLSWQHPTNSNGPIISYKLVFYPLATFNTQTQRIGETHRTSGLTAVIGGLQPNTNYSFHITPINIAAEGSQSLNVFCKTSEDVPSPPSNLIGFPSTETSVYLSWLHPKKPNGILTHHTVYFRMIDKSSESFEIKRTVPGNVDYFEENGLDLARFKYVFSVTSSTRMGESQSSAQIIFNPPPSVETRLVGQSRSIEIEQGYPLSLPCRILGLENLSFGGGGGVSSGSTLPSDLAVSWTLNGKKVGFDGNVYMKPGQSDLIFFGVRKFDQGNYTCQLRNGNKNNSKKSKSSSKKVINGMDLAHQAQQLTYSLQVKGVPCIPEPSYRIEGRDIYIFWSVDERSTCDRPLGIILYYRSLGSISDWKKVIFQPTSRNYTLKEITCGSILNMYMVAFNEVGNSPDSHLMSVVVSHEVSGFPNSHELIISNISSVVLNLYPINMNRSFCPVETFSIALREYRSTEWLPGKDVKIQFRNEYAIQNLKPSSPYEITITIYGHTSTSTSRTKSFTFTTLNQFGETPSTDVLSKHMVTSEYSPLYSNLTLILPSVAAVIAVLVAFITVLAYCKARRRATSMERECSSKQQNDVNYGYLQQRKSLPHDEQFYSGLPCPPCTPGMEDISPYATFQISDPKKFHEESFSQEIVVSKFHPVMHGLPRGTNDKWIDRDPRQMPDSEDSESENTQRYSVIPSQQRLRINNPYQINPPNQKPPPLPYHSSTVFQHSQHLQQQAGDTSDCDEDDSSSSDPTRSTIDRRTAHKDREGRRGGKKKAGKEYQRSHGGTLKESGSATSLRRIKRKSANSDYSIAV